MTIKNLSLAFYSAIFTAFVLKLADKFKMSFRGAGPVFPQLPTSLYGGAFHKDLENERWAHSV